MSSVIVMALAMVSCSKSGNGEVEYLPFKETADGQWGMISMDGKVLFPEEFKNKPTIIRDGRFFVRNNNGFWEMYDASYNRENETYNFSKRNVQFPRFFALAK